MDAILYWNDVALEANRISHTNGKKEQTGPPLSARALAIVHLAMYDALAAVRGNPPALPPYLAGLPPVPAGATVDAAVAGAAHAALSALFPSQQAYFDVQHGLAGLSGPGTGAGRAFGRDVAQAILAARADDPGVSDAGYTPSEARGHHRVDPDNPGQGYHAPFYGENSTCFAASGRHPLAPPPPVSTANNSPYERALKEVRGKGLAPHLMGNVTANLRRGYLESLIGIYWAYDGALGLGTPPRLYNQIVREVAENLPNPAVPNTVDQNATLFALVNTAMADAGILAWEEKYRWDLWRPVVGIREHDPSMGPQGTPGSVIDTNCDCLWLPLGAPSSNAIRTEELAGGSYPSGEATIRNVKNATPNFPAYPSGHATFGAAALHITRLFYGTPLLDRNPDAHFAGRSFVSEELDGTTQDNTGTIRPKHVRDFPDGLWQMIEENGRSRVYLGVHWVFDAFAVNVSNDIDLAQNIGGVPLGLNIAEDIFANGLVAANGAPPV